MGVIDFLTEKWKNNPNPFLVHPNGEFKFKDILDYSGQELDYLGPGDVVALIGDFDPETIAILIKLIDLKAIIVPLTKETRDQHDYFFKAANVMYVIENSKVEKKDILRKKNDLFSKLERENEGGLVLFSSGTTSDPKAILHNLDTLMKRFRTPRPTLRTINFLLFDHIGGLNTLFHTLFNLGVVIVPENRRISTILNTCKKHHVELLPTTPTFLRLLLLSGMVPGKIPDSIKLVTYGTERMDQNTLTRLCDLLPNVDFRQTYGMSELGIFRIKSESRDSLYMKVGGEGIKTRIADNVLEIHSENKMEGYLNANSPFDKNGWYNTGDIVDVKGEFIQITGRNNELINIGGLKFMASEVEKEVLKFNGIKFATIIAKKNPITGQHIELIIEENIKDDIIIEDIREFLHERLPKHMMPSKIKIKNIKYSHRFKKKGI